MVEDFDVANAPFFPLFDIFVESAMVEYRFKHFLTEFKNTIYM